MTTLILLSIAVFVFIVFPIIYLFTQILSIIFYETTFMNVLKNLRRDRFAPKDGVIDEIPITSREGFNLKGSFFGPSVQNVLRFDLPWYRINTTYKGLLVRFHVPKKKLDPYLQIIKDNPEKKFMLRIRFDPMTFDIHEIKGLRPIHSENSASSSEKE